ncbi:hypothetical protein EYZ00_03560 [Hafnia paralvei]|uniref:hypothetical protein n=1 Tax=Hafnia paralvei TaxID=546367 RepID=UPI0010348D7A|nr:hypothetical protein [Hafnia paralvei]TBL55552.1 hypothetical protein EYZ00_03560 [Hafnia paralvei]
MNNLPIQTCESVVQQRDALEKKLADMAAEVESVKSRMQLLVDIVNNADNSYCMCGSAMKDHGIYGCGSPAGMFDYHYGKWIESKDETPATDAFTRDLMAKGVELFAEHLGSNEFAKESSMAYRFVDRIRKGINDAQ